SLTRAGTTLGSVPSAARAGIAHMPQLDALRAGAVFLVLVWHWWPQGGTVNAINHGRMGVVLFFVLSGFLISRILLEQRIAAVQAGVSRLQVLRAFILRRALRILPVYYLTIILVTLLPWTPESWWKNLGYFATYTANVRFWQQGWSFGAHLWTLSVEEQYYLGWPLVLLFVNLRLLPFLLFLIVAGAPLCRFLGSGHELVYVLTPSCLDSFGLGAALAYVWVCRPLNERHFHYAGACLTGVLAFLTAIGRAGPRVVWEPLLLSLAGVLLVGKTARGFTGPLGRLLEFKPITHTGKISYGIYLFHPFVGYYYERLHAHAAAFGWRLPFGRWLLVPHFGPEAMFVLYTLLTFVLAALSWSIVERPINDLRRGFGYLGKPRAPA
ncbi:MAG TPA: acyltransferase, partial [Vicinamibacteria bacterium]|nr:acyltransferase [Vicinamibacteria bacterium]